MSVLKISEENFEEEVINSNQTVIVDFYADWCGPCQMMSKVIDEIAEELDGQVKVGKVNTDDNFELAKKFEIMSIPTVMIFKNGNLEKTFIGLRDKKEILDAIE